MKALSLFLFVSCCMFSHAQLNYKHNAIRSGDEIVKQQVEYKDPGRSGENVIWDFSKLKSIDPEYKLKYFSPRMMPDSTFRMGFKKISVNEANPEDLIIGLEHRTRYFYRYKGDTLYSLGHENATSLLSYQQDIPLQIYPMAYRDSISSTYNSHTKYSGRVDFYLSGKHRTIVDAYGKMILPSKDTLSHVIRVKSVQTFLENDSLLKEDESPLNMTVETYRWYVTGYRYPIFETVHTLTRKDSIESDYHATAFFFPPQEHYYLWNDEENLEVLDSLANQEDHIKDPVNQHNQFNQLADFSYNFYPNPVQTNLHVEYYLEKPSDVSISFYNLNGQEVKSIPNQFHQEGFYSKEIDCSMLSTGSYILKLIVNNKIVNEKILKR